MLFDNFAVGPSNYVYGTPITDWVSYTPTFTGFGTVTLISALSRRVGDSLEFQGFAQSGTSTAVEARISLGYGGADGNVTTHTIPTPTAIAGDFGRGANAALSYATLVQPSKTYVVFGKSDASSALLSAVNGNALVGSNETFAWRGSVKITGWSSSTQMSDSYDGRLIAASYSTSVGTSVNATPAVIPFATKNYDTINSWNGTDTYTIPSAGKYSINATLTYAFGAYTAGNYIEIYLFKNGSQVYGSTQGASATASNYVSSIISTDIDCNAGDTIQIKARNDATRTLDTNAIHNVFTIKKIQSPATISATELIAARYTSASTSCANATLAQYNTLDFDTHGAVTTGASWKFTAPVSGLYTINQMFETTAAANTAGQFLGYVVYKNGTTTSKYVTLCYINSTSSIGYTAKGSIDIILNAGDYIDLRSSENLTSDPSLSGTAGLNYIEIKRVK
jgi:hypothetical protein